jgi:pre-mRNA-splicing factor 38A
LTALGALYLRMTADAPTVFSVLEPLLNDYRKLRRRNADGSWSITHIDEFIESLLNDDMVCELQMPYLAKRQVLEQRGVLDGPRSSFFDELDDDEVQEMLQEIEREE